MMCADIALHIAILFNLATHPAVPITDEFRVGPLRPNMSLAEVRKVTKQAGQSFKMGGNKRGWRYDSGHEAVRLQYVQDGPIFSLERCLPVGKTDRVRTIMTRYRMRMAKYGSPERWSDHEWRWGGEKLSGKSVPVPYVTVGVRRGEGDILGGRRKVCMVWNDDNRRPQE